VLGRSLGRFPVGIANRTCLPDPSWASDRTNVAGIFPFGGEVVRHSKLGKFHSFALYREVSNRELFAKIPSLLLVLLALSFSHYPGFMVKGEDRNKKRFKN